MLTALATTICCASSGAKKDALPPTVEAYRQLPKTALLPISYMGLETPGAQKPAEVAENFYHLAYYQFERGFRFQLQPRRGTFFQLLEDQSHTLPLYSPDNAIWREVFDRAKQQDIRLLIFINLFRYQDRQGDRFGISQPAALGFDLQLIRVQDAAVVFQAHYDETQKALSEDIFRLGKVVQRRAQWITVDEMTREAMESIQAQMPPATSFENKESAS